ncbi:LIM/homeobox protein Awh-like [Anopheles ziemanni]|uniref:LIM/homeobox protein Awh-like n=1 Tax=Anopheles ziemanni TaxID=345580 RepID=UPI0026605B07|nr:LIM/homeobox protein Awh-like [Anopheles ziemanni]
MGEQTEFKTCGGCTEQITDRYIFEVNGGTWHGSCLRCSVCFCPLDRQASCFLRDGDVYCKADYVKKFKTSCAKCARSISATDWVRRAREHVFHLACFACDSCGRQLSTGEQFAICEDRVLCKTHYMELIDDGTASSEDGCDADGNGGGGKNKSKRIRTTFTEEQIHILQANFQVDSNPDGQDLERIALATGLSKRVTQVWFQNSRARQKKHVHVPRAQDLFNGMRQDLNNNNNNSCSSSNSNDGSVPMHHLGSHGPEDCVLGKPSIFNSHGFLNLVV